MTDKSLIEHIRRTWIDYGSLIGSRIREEMNGDEKALELAKNLEEDWRELMSYVSKEIKNRKHLEETQEETKQRLKEKLKPFVRKEIKRLHEER